MQLEKDIKKGLEYCIFYVMLITGNMTYVVLVLNHPTSLASTNNIETNQYGSTKEDWDFEIL